MSFLNKIIGSTESRKIKEYEEIVRQINVLEPEIQTFDAMVLKQKTNSLRARLISGESLESMLPESFALVREAAVRTLGQRHYDVQLVGGQALHNRNIAEMKTGEGKTLVATLSAYLNALNGKGVHIVTVNDYLARRDGAWMGQIYSALGLSVGVINHDASYLYDESHTTPKDDETRDTTGSFKVQYDFLRPCTRKEAYLADITYGTNSEFGFDFLRDNIQYSPDRVTQRGHHYAIVDEVDSILIDEARTPLIISAPVAESERLYADFTRIAAALNEG